MAFRVPPTVFHPRPEVDSAVVEIARLEDPSPLAPAAARLAATAFGQRRKMLRRSLSGVLADPESALAKAGVDPRARPEDVDIGGFLAMAEVLNG